MIELDGDSHYNDRAKRYDKNRTAALELQGIRVIRFSNLEVLQDFEAVCGAIATVLRESPKT